MSDATDRKLPVWRSALYVPANVPRFIDGAHRRGADAIIVDLEDSVPLAERPAARRDLMATAKNVARGGADVIVRINRPWRQAMLALIAGMGSFAVSLVTLPIDRALGRPGLLGLAAVAALVCGLIGRRLSSKRRPA